MSIHVAIVKAWRWVTTKENLFGGLRFALLDMSAPMTTHPGQEALKRVRCIMWTFSEAKERPRGEGAVCVASQPYTTACTL